MSASHLSQEQLDHYADSKSKVLYGSSIAFLVLTNGFLITRLLAQFKSSRRLFLDDALLIFAALCGDITVSCTIVATHFGFGLHEYRILAEDPNAPQNLVKIFENVWITSVTQIACLFSVKLSLLFLYRRLFYVHQLWLRIAFFANMAYDILWFIGSLLYFILECSPSRAYWERFDPKHSGHCDENSIRHVSITLVISIVSNAALLILPLATLFTLQMSMRKRIGLGVVFGSGIFALVIAIIRVVELLTNTDISHDASYNIVSFLILTSAEQTIAIVTACWPTVIPVLVAMIRGESKPRARRKNPYYQNFSEMRGSYRDSYGPLNFPGAGGPLDAPGGQKTNIPGNRNSHNLEVSSHGLRAGQRVDPEEIHVTTDVEVSLDNGDYIPPKVRANV